MPHSISFDDLRRRILLVVALAILPAILILALSWREQQALLRRSTTDNLQRIVRLASTTHDYLLTSIRQEMKMMASLEEVRSGGQEQVTKLLTEWVRSEEYCVNMGLFNPDGTVYASVIPPPPGVNLSDRAYFQKALRDRTFSMGQYVVGRITGRHTLNFGYPVYAQDGQVRGVLYYALGIEWLKRLLSEVKLPEGAVFTVVDREGTVLARQPDSGGWVGRKLPNAPLIKVLLESKGEGTIEIQGLDGVKRVYAYRPIEISDGDTGIYASVGVPSNVVYAPVQRLLRTSILALIASVLLAGLAGWFIGDALIVGVQKRLHEASVTDEMTGLRNRRGFFLLAEQSARLAARSKKGFWVAALDLDGLKRVNDTQGHAAGDRLIISAAEALKRAFRESDIIARLGGDEYAVIAIDAPREQLETLKRRLAEGIARCGEAGGVAVKISSGWSYYDPDRPGVTIDRVLAEADAALYADKARRPR